MREKRREVDIECMKNEEECMRGKERRKNVEEKDRMYEKCRKMKQIECMREEEK